MIKVSGDPGVELYHKLCLKIWETEQWPEERRKSVFVTLPKKGDLQQCSNYRTIALISHASKILHKITMKRLENTISREVNETQAGFRPNRGTRDQIMNLRNMIEKTRETNTEMYMCFIDYTKAFDCVSHNKLLSDLKIFKVHYKVINLKQDLYKKQMATVCPEEGTSDWFPIKRGVRQGCILSLSLFCIYTERIMREVEHDGQHLDFQAIKMNGEEIKELRYADDTALISKTPDGTTYFSQSKTIVRKKISTSIHQKL
ncbi:retrovirus-related Pol polyprotein from type-2 retrotransposable element R2DM [Elysia marginata]|uniref:Retrovirus-related Pol polyprotein from type-2 retrotransposable element R2DM n=1 Tax=Elysia marginata TaxID=1093978 RepID=A0AAV4EC88_9GAST|nr:retrovirus-related Pol polyprotein from type-2 retrotransposable element R2DM [Elysia marginata]